MNEDLIFEQMKEKAMNAEPLGGTLKFIFEVVSGTLLIQTRIFILSA